jgi:uncharacterized protein YukE
MDATNPLSRMTAELKTEITTLRQYIERLREQLREAHDEVERQDQGVAQSQSV